MDPASSASRTRSLRPRKPPPPKADEPIGEPKTKSRSKRKGKEIESSDDQLKKVKIDTLDPDCKFLGDPIPEEEARQRWPHRYPDLVEKKITENNEEKVNGLGKIENEEDEVVLAKCHYRQAQIDDTIYNIGDNVSISSGNEGRNYIGHILEFFRTIDDRALCNTQWFYRAEDTVIGETHADLISEKHVFISDVKNDNPLDCILSRLEIAQLFQKIDPKVPDASLAKLDYVYNMKYSLEYMTFSNVPPSNGWPTPSVLLSGAGYDVPIFDAKSSACEASTSKQNKSELTLLDMYSGCGAMSTGLCLGASASGVSLVNKWAVDINKYACESLSFNHPETEAIYSSAENFLALLKEWERLCLEFGLLGNIPSETQNNFTSMNEDADEDNDSEELVVNKIVGIRVGDPEDKNKTGVFFKVRWEGFGPEEDTWEPPMNLSCNDRIKDYVTEVYNYNKLPLPGKVDVICGGPPCQGVSGYNRFRDEDEPLADAKNSQLIVFMDTVEFLQPRFVLMENVVDILKFADGYYGRYAMARLVSMDYQARLGMMVAGCYGLPQFRNRVLLWGASRNEMLPSYPLPTHDVVIKGQIPKAFEGNVVAYTEENKPELKSALFLGDAISDLPEVANDEVREEIPYGSPALTDFQNYIRLNKEAFVIKDFSMPQLTNVYDHIPLKLNQDDLERVCWIPKQKGANFRDLPGVIVRNNKVEWDPSVERVLLKSGKPLIPNYAVSFRDGSSSKPFGRLWWDETVSTVITRAEPHNHAIVHPLQDRVLTVRENARLQGFPDYYKFFGPIKERYIQIGNAVAVPVGRALGYALGLACQGLGQDAPVFTLPPDY